jgi:hypothetical protein
MIEKRNVEIVAGDLSIGANCLFDNLKDAKQVILYAQNTRQLSLSQSDSDLQLSMQLDASVLDELAIAWCKKRKLQGALGGPVGNEWGSPDCEYD